MSQKKSEKQEQQANIEKEISIPKSTIFLFTVFTSIVFVIADLQLHIVETSLLNHSIHDYFFQSTDDIFSTIGLGNYDSFKWIDDQLYLGYNLGLQFRDSSQIPIPLTFMRIVQKVADTDDNHRWTSPQREINSDFGIFGQYHYDEKLNGYPLYFAPYNVAFNETIEYGFDPLYGINLVTNQLNLLENQFLSIGTMQINIDAGYYSPSLQMISVLQIDFIYSAQGVVTQSINIRSFHMHYYGDAQDYIRFILEIIFLVFYGFFLIEAGLKIRDEIKHTFYDYFSKEDFINQQQFQSQAQKRRIGLGTDTKLDGIDPVQLSIDLAKNMEKEALILKKKIQLVFVAIKNHVSQIWNALDVLILILLGIGLGCWFETVIYQQPVQQIRNILDNATDYNDLFIDESTSNDLKKVNQILIDYVGTLTQYRRYISVSLLFISLKLLRYIIYLIPELQQYLKVIVKVSEYLVFYTILIATILMSLASFLYIYYGSFIERLTDLFSSFTFTICLMLGLNENWNEMNIYDPQTTFIFILFFYFIIVCIMINMYFVFVNFEFEQTQKDIIQQELIHQQQPDNILNHKHPYWNIYELGEKLLINFWFHLICKKKKIASYYTSKSKQEKSLARQFKRQSQFLNFNINFSDIMDPQTSSHDEKAEDGKNEQENVMVEQERKKIEQKTKEDFVHLIWRAVLLIIILVINFTVVQLYYSPSEGNLLEDAIKVKIESINSQYGQNFSSLNRDMDVPRWMIFTFPLLFDELILSKREIQTLFTKPDPWTNDTNLSDDENFVLFQMDDMQFENLFNGYSLSYFNLLLSNVVKLNTRMAKQYINPDTSFQKLQDKIIKTQLYSASDSLDADEKTTNFIQYDQNQTIMEIDFVSNDQSNGYEMYLELSSIVNALELIYELGFYNDPVVSFTIEFMTFNPVNNRGFAYVEIETVLSKTGVIQNKQININAIRKNSLSSSPEIAIFLLNIILVIIVAQYFKKTVRTMNLNNQSYKRWYNMFITNTMTDAQIWIRQRHKPEFLRKLNYLVDFSQLLNILFLTINGCQLGLMFYQFFRTNDLAAGTKLFNQNIQSFLSISYFTFQKPNTDQEVFSLMRELSQLNRIISYLSSFVIIIICLELIVLVTSNRYFAQMKSLIVYSTYHIPLMLIIMCGFILSFAATAHYLLGTSHEEFSTFFGSLVQFCNYIQIISSYKITDDKTVEMYLILVPYVLVTRFIILNLFLAITYRSYKLANQNKKKNGGKNKEISISMLEFLQISGKLLQFEKDLPKSHNDMYLTQLLKSFDPAVIYQLQKETIRTQISNTSVQQWAETVTNNLKKENEIIEPLSNAIQELINVYLRFNNDGNYNILELLNKQPDRKQVEFNMLYTLFNYYRTSIQQLEKFSEFFTYKNNKVRLQMYQHLKNFHNKKISDENQTEYQMKYISQLESKLEENLQSLRFVKQEIHKKNIPIPGEDDIEEEEQKDDSKNESEEAADYVPNPEQTKSIFSKKTLKRISDKKISFSTDDKQEQFENALQPFETPPAPKAAKKKKKKGSILSIVNLRKSTVAEK